MASRDFISSVTRFSSLSNTYGTTRVSAIAITVATLLGALTGCQNVQTAPQRGSEQIATKSVMPVPATRGKSGTAGILFAYDFENDENIVGSSGCRWRMVNKDTGESFFVDIKSGTSAAFGALSPGLYETGRLGCGISKVWDLTGIFKEGFRVEAGSVSYLGKLNFVFRNKALEEIRKASRAESASAFTQAITVLPPAAGETVSAFTLQRITTDMAQAASDGSGFDAFAVGVKDGSVLDPLVGSLQACEKKVSGQDTLRLGRLEYVALYKDGRFIEMKSRTDNNTFSDALRDCISARMADYKPSVKNSMEVRVKY